MRQKETWRSHFRLTTLSAVTVLVAVFVLLIGQRWYSMFEEQAEELGAQSLIIGANASAALAFDDSSAGSEMLAAFKHNPYVIEAALYRNDGTLLAQFHRYDNVSLPSVLGEPQGKIGSRLLSLRQMYCRFPVRLGNRNVGTIVLLASMARVYGELAEFFWFLFAIVAFAAALAYFASYRIRRRIRESQNELENSQAMIRQLSVHREKLVEEEHKRIAMEIHDDLGQILTTAMLQLKRLDKTLQTSDDTIVEQVREIQTLINDAFHSVKNIAMDLRPAVLNFGFVPALEWLVERTLGNSGIKFQIVAPNPVPALDERCSTMLFRISQESLTNIIRHSRARNVWIALKINNEHLSLTIEDDGIGFRNGTIKDKPGFGLLGMRERAESLQGVAEITSVPEKGVCVVVTLPLSAVIEKQTSI
jgi:signal transduction histidine kinase